MKSFVSLIFISSTFLFVAPSAHASKLTRWVENHAIPRGPSANKVNAATDQANTTALEAQNAIIALTPKVNSLVDILMWGSGGALGLIGLMLIGKNVIIWRQALSKHPQPDYARVSSQAKVGQTA